MHLHLRHSMETKRKTGSMGWLVFHCSFPWAYVLSKGRINLESNTIRLSHFICTIYEGFLGQNVLYGFYSTMCESVSSFPTKIEMRKNWWKISFHVTWNVHTFRRFMKYSNILETSSSPSNRFHFWSNQSSFHKIYASISMNFRVWTWLNAWDNEFFFPFSPIPTFASEFIAKYKLKR